MSDGSSAVKTLVQKKQGISQLEGISEINISFQELKKSQYRPLAHLAKTEERIREQAELNNELEIMTNLWTYAVKTAKNTGFCPLLNYPKSNCNGKYFDGNCFETKTLGCRDERVYLTLKKLTGNEIFSLSSSSHLSRFIDFIYPRR